ncbi:SDR family NAD(P)-dependent oxidoreductase [Georgenia sp. AZ-5]|uniref:SDR family NAD(P)-dependent oxidoreductase n=1 Tax=Georgenia sp. AZ-5 TaxID=3367526 RepID=UPI003754C29D
MSGQVLAGRVALVTGASRGLGAAIAGGYAHEGAQVVGAARSTGQLQQLVAQDPERISALQLDARDPRSATQAVEEVVRRHGRIDILVNNAGIAPAGDFLTQDPAVWRDTLEVNVIAPMLLAQAAGRHFVEQGGGKIINVASTTGLRGKPVLVGYSTSKGAVLRMTESLAAEWARHNIQVNAIAPGAFSTEAQRAVTEDADLLAKRVRRIPAKRMGRPEEIIPLAVLLASAGSDFITGSTFVIDGGEAGKL